MRTAELEVVRYKSEDLFAASSALIYNYANYSGLEGTRLWPTILVSIASIIKRESSDQLRWQTPGLTVEFSGIPPVLPRIEDNRLVYMASAPHFVLEEDIETPIRPAVRTHIERVTEAIVDEMRDVYKLEPKKSGGLLFLNFPKEEYAEKIDRFEVPVLS